MAGHQVYRAHVRWRSPRFRDINPSCLDGCALRTSSAWHAQAPVSALRSSIPVTCLPVSANGELAVMGLGEPMPYFGTATLQAEPPTQNSGMGAC